MEHLELALTLSGLIVGLGAVTVIDLHGFLARRSQYWTEATIRTHKVTKPLIWTGTLLYGAGIILMYRDAYGAGLHPLQLAALAVMILNGLFLTFAVSPFLLRQEAAGRARDLMPASWQAAVTVSFLISVAGWWGSVAMLVIDLAARLR